ncbi:tRNA (adenosine(37)-N6)-threonylcarbamoyltransferase complex transferase subunit TsaD [Candidatus Saccharibacteria bacterium]|nr:tRNA (adenosine(37)-N6)-threonylcarbamoyltransferase complex transferase subunit TsaD [Candidatus Saccharibacteria bacterium]
MKILGIETSCDETSAAIVEDGRRLLCNVVNTQIDIHKVYGGVVPEIAARSHLEVMIPVVEEAFSRANCSWDDIDAIAITYAPGLIGSLLVGTLTARLLAITKQKPLFPIHHVEAHVYANYLVETSGESVADYKLPAEQPRFPMLALIVSGGHSQLALFRDHGDYTLLGQTQDDAVGEAFDKVAKIIGLPYPGGPSIAKAATLGDPYAFKLPKAKLQGAYDFSFSGLKTAVLRAIQAHVGVGYDFPSFQLAERLDEATRHNMAASFQRIAVETLVDKAFKAYQDYSPASVVIAGGVAANQELRRQLAERLPIPIEYPDIRLCTDNAAMIATLGYYRAQRQQPVDPLVLEVAPSLSM